MKSPDVRGISPSPNPLFRSRPDSFALGICNGPSESDRWSRRCCACGNKHRLEGQDGQGKPGRFGLPYRAPGPHLKRQGGWGGWGGFKLPSDVSQEPGAKRPRFKARKSTRLAGQLRVTGQPSDTGTGVSPDRPEIRESQTSQSTARHASSRFLHTKSDWVPIQHHQVDFCSLMQGADLPERLWFSFGGCIPWINLNPHEG